MTTKTFDPNRLSFQQCLESIRKAVGGDALRNDGIVTSRDERVEAVMDKLAIDNVPPGFQKWQLPVYLDGPSQLFISIAEPGVSVPAHAHEEGDGIRFIAGGSILYDGRELVAGDWMFIPSGTPYEFEAGRYGAMMIYCYRCCCS